MQPQLRLGHSFGALLTKREFSKKKTYVKIECGYIKRAISHDDRECSLFDPPPWMLDAANSADSRQNTNLRWIPASKGGQWLDPVARCRSCVRTPRNCCDKAEMSYWRFHPPLSHLNVGWVLEWLTWGLVYLSVYSPNSPMPRPLSSRRSSVWARSTMRSSAARTMRGWLGRVSADITQEFGCLIFKFLKNCVNHPKRKMNKKHPSNNFWWSIPGYPFDITFWSYVSQNPKLLQKHVY